MSSGPKSIPRGRRPQRAQQDPSETPPALGNAAGVVSDFRRDGAAERAVWPAGRAGTTAPIGLELGPRIHFDQPLK
eukprot:6543361-Alexandrium_andersonii.AAC.1